MVEIDSCNKQLLISTIDSKKKLRKKIKRSKKWKLKIWEVKKKKKKKNCERDGWIASSAILGILH